MTKKSSFLFICHLTNCPGVYLGQSPGELPGPNICSQILIVIPHPTTSSTARQIFIYYASCKLGCGASNFDNYKQAA